MIRARRLSGEAQHQATALARIDIQVGITDVENRLGVAEFEIQTARADLDLREGRVRAARRCAAEQLLEIPHARSGLHEVHAGLDQTQIRKRQMTRQQTDEVNAGLQEVHVGEGLDARRRIVIDQNVLDRKARTSEQIEVRVAYRDVPVERHFQRAADLFAIAIGLQVRRNNADGKHHQNAGHQRSAKTAPLHAGCPASS